MIKIIIAMESWFDEKIKKTFKKYKYENRNA